MGFTFAPKHLKRYEEIARLLFKYGRSPLVTGAGLGEFLPEQEQEKIETVDPETEALAQQLAGDLEKMGPIYIKLGQVLSSRSDLLPAPFVKALSRLQDKLDPFPYTEVEETVEHELGVRISKGFAEFEPTPIAAASLGQVHRAALRSGRPVVVKVQRPGVRKQIAEDMEILAEICAFVDAHTEIGRRFHFSEMLEEFRKNLLRELDYQQEAHHLAQLRHNLQGFHRIVVPEPIVDYTTSRVLTMDYIAGKNISGLSTLGLMEIDGSAMAEELSRAYLQQILVDGLFHADPHPGNIFITEEGRIALIDLGMVGYLSHGMQEQLLKLLLAISERDSDKAADLAIKIGEPLDHFDEAGFRRRVADIVTQYQDVTVEEIQIGKAFLSFTQISGDSGIRMPPELTMLGKTLLNLDEIERTLDPSFDPNESIRRNAAEIVRQRTLQAISPANIFSAVMDAKEFVDALPNRANRILDILAKNQFKIRVEAIDETTLIEGFQKVANRITMGLVLAALIIGAAMLMRVNTSFRIFGYPGLAMLCFLAAAAGGCWLVISILIADRNARRKRP